MRVTVLRLVAAIGFTAVGFSQAWAADPSGTYTRPSTGTQVNFYDCGGKICGKIVGVKDPAKKGTIGTVIMKGADKTGENTWKGDLFNVDDGKTYAGVLTLVAKGVKLEGCVLGGIICKGETWSRNTN